MQSQVDDSLDVSTVAIPEVQLLISNLDVSELIVERLGDIRRNRVAHDVLNKLGLRIKDDITQLSKVVYHHLRLVILKEKNLAGETLEDFVVVQKFA